jgi:hypothetical protein
MKNYENKTCDLIYEQNQILVSETDRCFKFSYAWD